jgi:hypothetical protein
VWVTKWDDPKEERPVWIPGTDQMKHARGTTR